LPVFLFSLFTDFIEKLVFLFGQVIVDQATKLGEREKKINLARNRQSSWKTIFPIWFPTYYRKGY
jgi:hypothetical protein